MNTFKFSSEVPESCGIKSFCDGRFWIAFVLLSLSLFTIIFDPYFIDKGEFVYRQGVVVLIMALTIASAFFWETPIFGKPAGANLLLQSYAIVPFALLVTRLCASDGGSSAARASIEYTGFLGKTLNFLLETLNKLLAHIPDFIWNIFNNWRISLLFLLVLAILCFRNIKIRTGAICFVLLFLFFVQLDRGGKLFYLFGAILLLIAGLFLMFSRYDKTSYYENILKRVRHSQTIGTEELRTILLVMEQMEHKKCMSDENFRQIVKDCYSADHLYSGNEINLISGELAKRMIHNYNLLSLRNDGDGIFLFPDPLLFSDDNLLRSIATTPRIIFVGFLALLWVLMPFDLIPDFMPFIGALDDITVLILSGTVIQNSSLPVSKRK